MISSEQWERFFGNLQETGIVKLAAVAAGISRTTIYDHLDAARGENPTDEAKAWLARYRSAERAAIDTLEAEAFRRGVEGVKEPLIGRIEKDKDGIVAYVTRYSDPLVMFLLRARDPARFKDRTATELTGKNGGPIQTEQKVIAVPAIDETQPE